MGHLHKFVHKDLVDGLPHLHFEKNILYNVCQKSKQVIAYFKTKNIVSTNQPLQLLHMDIFDPSKTCLGENVYILIMTTFSTELLASLLL